MSLNTIESYSFLKWYIVFTITWPLMIRRHQTGQIWMALFFFKGIYANYLVTKSACVGREWHPNVIWTKVWSQHIARTWASLLPSMNINRRSAFQLLSRLQFLNNYHRMYTVFSPWEMRLSKHFWPSWTLLQKICPTLLSMTVSCKMVVIRWYILKDQYAEEAITWFFSKRRSQVPTQPYCETWFFWKFEFKIMSKKGILV